MRKRFGVVIGWVLATIVSILIASNAVGAVQGEVTSSPSPLHTTVAQQVVSTTVLATTTSLESTSSTTSPPPSTTSTIASTTTSTPGGATTTTSAVPVTTTTSAPSPSTTTTSTTTTSTTTTVAPSEFLSYELIGGSVRIRVTGDEVWFEGATPAPGFAVEIDGRGPERVAVEFESNTHESRLEVEIENGELVVELEEENSEK